MNASYLLLGDLAMGNSSRQRPSRSIIGAPAGVHQSCCREILRLNSENARLEDELERFRLRHDDLTKSTEIWIRLYETYLALATERARQDATPQ